MKIFKTKSGEISPQPTWVCFYSCYMHTNDSLLANTSIQLNSIATNAQETK